MASARRSASISPPKPASRLASSSRLPVRSSRASPPSPALTPRIACRQSSKYRPKAPAHRSEQARYSSRASALSAATGQPSASTTRAAVMLRPDATLEGDAVLRLYRLHGHQPAERIARQSQLGSAFLALGQCLGFLYQRLHLGAVVCFRFLSKMQPLGNLPGQLLALLQRIGSQALLYSIVQSAMQLGQRLHLLLPFGLGLADLGHLLPSRAAAGIDGRLPLHGAKLGLDQGAGVDQFVSGSGAAGQQVMCISDRHGLALQGSAMGDAVQFGAVDQMAGKLCELIQGSSRSADFAASSVASKI